MRILRVSALALLCVIPLTHSFTASEDPLPLVQPKSIEPVNETPQSSSTLDLFAPAQIVMEVYPLADFASKVVLIQTSDPGQLLKVLNEAVVANDVVRFDAALDRAKTVAEALPESSERTALRRAVTIYSDLQQVWHFASTDKFGAFYDDESLPGLRQRLTREYSGYGTFISELRIVDQNGRTFYPTAETRTFLLKQLDSKTFRIASHATAPASRATAPIVEKPHAATMTTTTPKHATQATHVTHAPKKVRAPHVAKTKPAAVVATQPVAKTKPVVETPAPLPVPAPVVAAAPTATTALAPVPAPVPVSAPVAETASGATSQTATSQTATSQPATSSTTTTVGEPPAETSTDNRAILILIIGIVALGITMLFLRRGSAKPPVTKVAEPPKPAEAPKPVAAPKPAEAPKPKGDETNPVRHIGGSR